MLVIDADQHMNETIGTWDAVDASVGNPMRFVEDEAGNRVLVAGDQVLMPARPLRPDTNRRIEAMVAEDPDAWDRERAADLANAVPFVDAEHPGGDPARRVLELDEQGTAAAVLYPTYGLFWSALAVAKGYPTPWIDAHLAAWNTWIAELASRNDDRLLGIAQVELHDVDRTVAELHRCKALGLRGALIHMRTYRDVPWSDPSNEPVWDAFEETGLALVLHIAAAPTVIDKVWLAAEVQAPVHSGQSFRGMLNRSYPVEAVLTDLIVEGVLARHPRMRVGVIECGGAWVHGYLDRLDWTWKFLAPRNSYLRNRLDGLPSEYFHRHVKVALLPGEQPKTYFDLVGPDVFMYSSDFPHNEGTAHGIDLFRAELAGYADAGGLDGFWHGNAAWYLGVEPADR